MDPVSRVMTTNSIRFVLQQICNLGLQCFSAQNRCPSPQDVEFIVGSLFNDNVPSLNLQQFTQRVMMQFQNPQMHLPWFMFQDCFGIFSYFRMNFIDPIYQILDNSKENENMLINRKPYKEGWLTKYVRTTLTDPWCKHWAVVSNGFLYYYPSQNTFDKVSKVFYLGDCEIYKPNEAANEPPYCFYLKIQGVLRKFLAADDDEYRRWVRVIKLSRTQAKYENSSFAPIREGMSGRWFIDGEDTYRLMEETIEKATQEIFITDWFFSPQVYLKRFDSQGRQSLEMEHRLDVVLQKKANQGVKIYVLPWSETKIAIDLGSANVKSVLGLCFSFSFFYLKSIIVYLFFFFVLF